MQHTRWWKQSVVYQIYPRSFCDSNGDGIGDINGIISKLDYLADLGIDVIWLSPIYASPGADNGYDISDYRAILPEFGTMEDFERLLDEAHRRNLRIVMDLVVNHTSDEHPWFKSARADKSSPYHDYYIWREGRGDAPPNNWGSWFYGPAWERVEEAGEYYLHIFAPKQPDLNWDNPALREEIYDMMTWWLDKGVDGFRMDVISLISKHPSYADGLPKHTGDPYGDLTPYCENGPRVHEYLQEMNRRVLARYDVMTVGETPNATVDDAARYTNSDGTELNMVFQFEHMTIDHGPYGKYTQNRFAPADLIRAMSKWQEGLHEKGWNSLYWENHDQPRSVSRFGDTSSPELWNKSAKMLATCLHMLQGTPYIYQGQEIGMTNPCFPSLNDYHDIEAKNAFRDLVLEQKVMSEDDFLRCIHNLGRDNARTPMQWTNGENAGFTTGVPWMRVNPNYTGINAEAQTGDADSILQYYKTLIRLRKEHPVITNGKYELLDAGLDSIWAYKRTSPDASLLVLCNFSAASHALDEQLLQGFDTILISNYAQPCDGKLRSYEAVVYHRAKRLCGVWGRAVKYARRTGQTKKRPGITPNLS